MRALLESLSNATRGLEAWEETKKEPERARLLSVLQAYADKPRPTAWEHLLKPDEGL